MRPDQIFMSSKSPPMMEEKCNHNTYIPTNLPEYESTLGVYNYEIDLWAKARASESERKMHRAKASEIFF